MVPYSSYGISVTGLVLCFVILVGQLEIGGSPNMLSMDMIVWHLDCF
jgi:hypothetical protein